MKRYVIVSLIILIGVGAVGITYLGVDKIGIDFGEPSFISENISHSSVFNCAKTYDEMRDIYYNEWNPTAPINSSTNYLVREKMAEKEDLLLENSCFEKKGDWAYKSKYENELWGIEKAQEITFSQCIEDYRSKYCLFNEGNECKREVYQNALDICDKYR